MYLFFRALFASFFLCGVIYLLRSQVDNDCDMTYMYEYPLYQKVPLPDEVSSNYPNYNLYLYGEGEYFGRIKNLDIEGIPVLFIPGHGGSYKQMRSIASILLRKSMGRNDGIHFNVFGVDLVEEFTAMYGGTLEDQQAFVEASIDKILSLYKGENRPTSVVLIGHSMGGVLARGLSKNNPRFDKNKVEVIIALAAPLLQPVVDVDHYLHEYYNKLNAAPSKYEKEDTTTFISIAGGDTRDMQVSSALTRPPSATWTNYTTSVQSPNIPQVHVAADHQCIVWCKQLQIVIQRFLYSIVDVDTRQIQADPQARQQSARHHFVSQSNHKYSVTSNNDVIPLIDTYAWEPVTERYCWTSRGYKPKSKNGAYFVFSVEDLLYHNGDQAEFVVRTTLDREHWVLGCKMNEENGYRCKTGIDLSKSGILMNKTRVLHLNLLDLRDRQHLTHIVIPVSWSRFNSLLDVNVMPTARFTTPIVAPYMAAYAWTLGRGDRYQLKMTDRRCSNRFYNRLEIDGFSSIYQHYDIWTVNNHPELKLSARVQIPWDEGQNSVHKDANLMTLGFRSSGPDKAPPVVVHYYHMSQQQAPTTLEVAMRFNFYEYNGKVTRYFFNTFVPYAIAHLMIILGYHLKQTAKSAPLHDWCAVHDFHAKGFKYQPIFALIGLFFGIPRIRGVWLRLGLPLPDFILATEYKSLWYGGASICLFMLGFELIRFTLMVQAFVIYLLRFPLRLIGDRFDMIRIPIHVVMLAILVARHSFLALCYCYVMSLLRSARLRDQVVYVAKQPEKLAVKGDDVTQDSDFADSDEDSNESWENLDDDQSQVESRVGSESTTDKNLNQENELAIEEKENNFENDENLSENERDLFEDDKFFSDGSSESKEKQQSILQPPQPVWPATTPEQDEYVWNAMCTQLWMWFMLLAVPSFVAHVARPTTGTQDPLHSLTVATCLMFCLWSLKRERLQEAGPKLNQAKEMVGKLGEFIAHISVLFGTVSCYRMPYFVFIALGLQMLPQFYETVAFVMSF